MRNLSIKQSQVINASVDKGWDIIGPNFTHIAEWSRGVYKSWENESVKLKFEDAPVGGRYCDVAGFGKFDEQITHFDKEKHEISWSATGEKLPKFITGLQNELTIEEIDDHTCRVTSTITADMKGIRGMLLGSMINRNFTKTINGFLTDLKTYAETGHVSEKKQDEISKNLH